MPKKSKKSKSTENDQNEIPEEKKKLLPKKLMINREVFFKYWKYSFFNALPKDSDFRAKIDNLDESICDDLISKIKDCTSDNVLSTIYKCITGEEKVFGKYDNLYRMIFPVETLSLYKADCVTIKEEEFEKL